MVAEKRKLRYHFECRKILFPYLWLEKKKEKSLCSREYLMIIWFNGGEFLFEREERNQRKIEISLLLYSFCQFSLKSERVKNLSKLLS